MLRQFLFLDTSMLTAGLSAQAHDAFTPYEQGLRRLLDLVGSSHSRYPQVLVYQQRLVENITHSRLYGDTDSRKADRAEIICQLDTLAFSELQITFSELYASFVSMPNTETSERSFQRWYEALQYQKAVRFLDTFGIDTWDKLYRGEILEVQASIKLPKPLLMAQDLKGLYPYLDILKQAGVNPFAVPEQNVAFEGMYAVSELTEDKPVPLIFEAVSTRRFHFATYLQRQYLHCELTDLQGEAVIFGKIQRILQKGEKHEVFSLFPPITNMSVLNRAQRRKMQKDAAQKQLLEEIKGPAIIMTPIAVYR